MKLPFLTHHNLQGSQTTLTMFTTKVKFLTHHNLQGSQTKGDFTYQRKDSFLPIIIYKVLKPQIRILAITEPTCLTTAKL